MMLTTLITLTLTLAHVHGAPVARAASKAVQLQNGIDAQKLNAQFKSLTSTSNCTDGEQACLNGSFAQCANGAFVVTPCGAGTTCVVLPLLNSAGTSVSCDYLSDAAARIAASGASGGIDGSASSVTNSTAASPTSTTASSGTIASTNASSTSSPTATSSDFHLQNGLDAQKLNAKFTSLTANSSCTEGEQACVGGSFAQCTNGAFVLRSCGTGKTCAALPLVNAPGTSIACDTVSDATARIAATGVSGGIDGSASGSTSANSTSSTNSTSSSSSSPVPPAFLKINGQEAQAQNAAFKDLTANSACSGDEQACIGNAFAHCVSGAYVLTPCGTGMICAALPLPNLPGTTVACDAADDAKARMLASGVSGGLTGSG